MRVAVLGAGYAGLGVARRLESRLSDDVELVVIDESGRHLVQHLLHRTIRRPSLADDLLIPLEAALDRATVLRRSVRSVDPDAGTVETRGGTVEYDVGAICLGAETAYYGVPGLREHGTPLKRPDHARAIRSGFLTVVDRGGRTVVGGAGLSGVQVAGELAALAAERDRPLDGADGPTVTLVEQRDGVVPGFPDRFREAVRAALEEYGVDVRTGTAVAAADAEGLELADGATLPCDQLVWTGGITGPGALGADRPVVRGDLRLSDRTLALGDAARVIGADGEEAPATAQAAIREAEVAAENVERLVSASDDPGSFAPRLETFAFDPAGWFVTVGDEAVAQVGPSVVTGRAASALKTSVGAGYLSSVGAVRNAARVVADEFGHAGEG